MRMNQPGAFRAAVLLLAAATALTACGRKVPLDRPGVAAQPPAAENGSLFGSVAETDGADGTGDDLAAPAAEPERRFILDPLID